MSTHFNVSTFYYPLSKILSFSSYTSTEVTAYHKKTTTQFSAMALPVRFLYQTP